MQTTISKQQAQHYTSLFGEDGEIKGQEPEFLHIEDIKTRSHLYDWQIAPHSHPSMFQILFVQKGTTEIWLDQKTQTITAPCVVTIPSGVVHAFAFSPDTIGSVVTISDFLLLDSRYQRSRILFEPLFNTPQILDLQNNIPQADRMVRILDLMKGEFDFPDIGRNSMFEWLLRIILMLIRRQITTTNIEPTAKGYSRDVFTSFCDLIDTNYRNHWSIAQYAKEMGMSQARLNRLCRVFKQHTALDLVQDRLVLEAQRLLTYTSATAAMVAYELGFQDPAYFSRFFKRRTTLAPGQFQSQVTKTTNKDE